MNALSTPQPMQPFTERSFSPVPRRNSFFLNGHVLPFTIAAGLAMATAGECESITHLPSLFYGAVVWMWWAVIATLLWALNRRWPVVASIAPRAIASHLVAASCLGCAHLFLLWSICIPPSGANSPKGQELWRYFANPNRFGIEILIYGFVLALTGLLHARLRAQGEAMRTLELERQLSAAQLQALQMQLEPHFLFNTLNAITSLVELGRQQQAAEMLSHLNRILKVTLQRGTPQKVPLFQELELIENYLAVEQVRFADRLRFDLRVDPGALNGLVPCFLLQPIVENAIRHGTSRCEDASFIEASARLEDGNLILRVRDTGPAPLAAITSGGHGIGLKNTRERLAHFYPERHTMHAQPLASGGFEVAITIPYESQAW